VLVTNGAVVYWLQGYDRLFGAFFTNVKISTNRPTSTSRKIGNQPPISPRPFHFVWISLVSSLVLSLSFSKQSTMVMAKSSVHVVVERGASAFEAAGWRAAEFLWHFWWLSSVSVTHLVWGFFG
jgi:hypothetical protein